MSREEMMWETLHDQIHDQVDEIASLRAILAPLLAHAASHDYAPPLKFSVQQCRDIKERVDGI